jgi:hypothetical protein
MPEVVSDLPYGFKKILIVPTRARMGYFPNAHFWAS